ncbi:MAG: hypothetical protein KJ592_00125 [Nanoarchaeota archaeon]|nr:hypothetical protein [Nanoarchaeota archaeon]
MGNKKAQVMPMDYIAGAIIIIGGVSYFFGQSTWGGIIVTLGVFVELLTKKLMEVL